MSIPRVAFFCPLWGRPGPFRLGWSDYWRLALPAVELHRRGWDVVMGRAVGPGLGGRLSVMDPNEVWWDDRDVLVFQRWMSDDAPRLISVAREAGQVCVNDVDDLLWDMPADHPGREQMSRPDYNLDNWLGTLRESSLLTTSTPYLERAVADFGPPVRTIRNYVDLKAWGKRTPGRYVGWVGATAGRTKDLELLRPVASWLKERGEVLYHGGAIPGEPLLMEIVDHIVTTRPFQMPPTYPRLWDPLRVALCPLSSLPFSQAKSWVKALEACARGIPFVASDHPEYRALGVGRLAASPGEWVEHLDALGDPAVYARDCATNLARAKELAITDHGGEWERAIKSVTPAEESRLALRPS